jgi:hypothetical protein
MCVDDSRQAALDLADLVGERILAVRPMLASEMDRMGWPGEPGAVVETEGGWVLMSCVSADGGRAGCMVARTPGGSVVGFRKGKVAHV